MCEHSELSAPTDVLTILPRHEHLIHLFVRWKAWQELAKTPFPNLTPLYRWSLAKPNLLKYLRSRYHATRAERQYREALRVAKKAETESSKIEGFRMDKWDRTY